MIPTPKASSTRENVHEAVDRLSISTPIPGNSCLLTHFYSPFSSYPLDASNIFL